MMVFVATSMSEVAIKEGKREEGKKNITRVPGYLMKRFPREKHATLVDDNVVEGDWST